MAGNGGAAPGGAVSCYSNNIQGGCNVGFVVGQIKSHDVTMLQESGSPGWVKNLAPTPNGLLVGVVNFGTTHRPEQRNVAHYPNGRCSLTLLTDVALGPLVPQLLPAPAPTLRPMLVGSTQNMNFGNFHGPSGNSNAATAVIQGQVAQLANLPGLGFIAMGDANSDLNQQTNAIATGHAPLGATHQGGGSLDGAITSPHIIADVKNVGMKAGDHAGIEGTYH